jgi:hypothetical protein
MPPLDLAEAEDEEQAAAAAELLDYEVGSDSWAPIAIGGIPKSRIRRFVDGSVFSVTAGTCRIDGSFRPLLVGALGALELELAGRRLFRPQVGYRIAVVAAMLTAGIAEGPLHRLKDLCSDAGIQLLALDTDVDANYEVLRRRTWDVLKQEMEGLERELLLNRPDCPTLADGLLERRLTTIESQQQPVVGMVKRNLRRYLPPRLETLLYDLSAGQRSPAFVIKTPHAELVSWYLRLTDGPMSPGSGLVRLAAPREYLERALTIPDRFAELNGWSNQLVGWRCRQESYARHRVSLDPIVEVEDQLHALLPEAGYYAGKLKLRLNPRRGAT